MSYPLSVRTENSYLASAFGSEEGHPRFQWRWGEDIKMPVVLMDDSGARIVDYHCACGINKVVHTNPACNWTTVIPRWEVRCLVPQYASQWVMTRWVKPEASRDDWAAEFGALPYPELGYYIPVADPQHTLCLREGLSPTRNETLIVMAALADHYSVSPAERIRRMREAAEEAERTSLDPDQMGSKQREYYQRVKDIAPVGLLDEYGRTTQWHGQTGVGPSPTERKLVKLVE